MQEEVRRETTWKKKYTHGNTHPFTLLLFVFPTRNKSEERHIQALFLKFLCLLRTVRKAPGGAWIQGGRIHSRSHSPLTIYQENAWNTGRNIQKRQEKNMAHLTYTLYTRTSASPNIFTLGSFTRFLAGFSPAAAELRQTVRHTGKQYFDPACTVSVPLSKRVTHASPKKSSGACSCLLCGAEG